MTGPANPDPTDAPRGHSKVVLRLVTLVFVMLGASFAAVPFYDWFCRVTGFGGVPAVAETGADEILDRTINIRFDASLARNMPWEFKPHEREIEIRIGETGLAFYEAYNPTDRPIAGSATFNVTPYSAGEFFTKIDCFCFEEQVLEPGQRVDMPVSFYVDPDILAHAEANNVHTITLSYTFYQTELPDTDVTRLETATETGQKTN